MIHESKFTKDEIEVLRKLASRVRDLADRDIEKEKRNKWIEINELRSSIPVVFADPENGWNEIIRQSDLKCSNQLARQWEFSLLRKIFWAKNIKDDRVIEPFFDVGYTHTNTGWGVDIKFKKTSEKNGAYHIIPSINDYEEDFPKIKFPKLIIDFEKTEEIYELAKNIFDGILIVRKKSSWWWTLGMTWDYINLRGLDTFMTDMILEPEWVHRMMEFLLNGNLEKLKFLESNNLLSANNDDSYVGSGGFGYIESELIRDKNEPVMLKDMWGFAESQETVGVSPAMFHEFIMPYQMKLLEKFGLNCYGCCEPINTRWDDVKKIPRLRRVSSSPWADRAAMAMQLEDKYIMSIKASPTLISMHDIDERLVRKEVKDILEATKGCQVEIIMKDNHTLGNNPNNIVRWVEIVREEISKIYKI